MRGREVSRQSFLLQPCQGRGSRGGIAALQNQRYLNAQDHVPK